MAFKRTLITTNVQNSQNSIKRSQFYKGFSTVNDDQKSTKLYDFELIKQDLINQFSIRKGERVMDPEFGTIIWNILFDPFTDSVKNEIGADIKRICTADPRITPTIINVIEQEYGMLIELTLIYNGTDQSENLRVVFDKEIGMPTLSS